MAKRAKIAFTEFLYIMEKLAKDTDKNYVGL